MACCKNLENMYRPRDRWRRLAEISAGLGPARTARQKVDGKGHASRAEVIAFETGVYAGVHKDVTRTTGTGSYRATMFIVRRNKPLRRDPSVRGWYDWY